MNVGLRGVAGIAVLVFFLVPTGAASAAPENLATRCLLSIPRAMDDPAGTRLYCPELRKYLVNSDIYELLESDPPDTYFYINELLDYEALIESRHSSFGRRRAIAKNAAHFVAELPADPPPPESWSLVKWLNELLREWLGDTRQSDAPQWLTDFLENLKISENVVKWFYWGVLLMLLAFTGWFVWREFGALLLKRRAGGSFRPPEPLATRTRSANIMSPCQIQNASPNQQPALLLSYLLHVLGSNRESSVGKALTNREILNKVAPTRSAFHERLLDFMRRVEAVSYGGRQINEEQLDLMHRDVKRLVDATNASGSR